MVRWREFEALAGQILVDLAPRADVRVDDHIFGRLSEAPRQIDVSVRWQEAEQDHLLIVQARDRSTPADVNAVGEFAAVIEDVGADHGILVCRSGFTRTARNNARNRGILLWNLHDATSADWNLQLTVPIVWIDLFPDVRVMFAGNYEAGDQLLPYRDAPYALTPDGGSTVLNLLTTFEDAWNGGTIPRNPGQEHRVTITQTGVSVMVDTANGERALRPVDDLGLQYMVRRSGAWLGYFTPTECRGFVDSLNQEAFVVSSLPIGQVPFERDERWQPIDDPADVASTIRGTFVTTQNYSLILAGSGQLTDVSFERCEDPDQPDEPSGGHDSGGRSEGEAT